MPPSREPRLLVIEEKKSGSSSSKTWDALSNVPSVTLDFVLELLPQARL